MRARRRSAIILPGVATKQDPEPPRCVCCAFSSLRDDHSALHYTSYSKYSAMLLKIFLQEKNLILCDLSKAFVNSRAEIHSSAVAQKGSFLNYCIAFIDGCGKPFHASFTITLSTLHHLHLAHYINTSSHQ